MIVKIAPIKSARDGGAGASCTVHTITPPREGALYQNYYLVYFSPSKHENRFGLVATLFRTSTFEFT